MSAASAPSQSRGIRANDVVVVLAAAPFLLLVGVSAVGYLIGGAAWILIRVLGVAVDRHATSLHNVVHRASLRLAYRMTRVVLLVGAAVAASKAGGKDEGLAALLVIVIAFTIQLAVTIIERAGLR
jgi:hypothetical protein